MKSNLLVTILNWILATSLILSLIFSYQFFKRTRELRTETLTLQQEQVRFQQNIGSMNMLINDLVEYSKKNPKINPILESIGIGKQPSATAQPAK